MNQIIIVSLKFTTNCQFVRYSKPNITNVDVINIFRNGIIFNAENKFFVGTGIPRPLVQNIANDKIKESSQSVINDYILISCQKGWLKYSTYNRFKVNGLEKLKKTQNSSQLLIYVNYCNLKKVSLIPV